MNFSADAAGYVCGVRFYAIDTEPGRTVSLWDSSGTQQRTATSPENVSVPNWQMVNFSTPYAIAANTAFTVSFHTAQFDYGQNFYRNGGTDNANLHVIPFYVDSPNLSCKYSDAWPLDGRSRPAAGEVGCVDVANGVIATTQRGDDSSSEFAVEGCQCMIGGEGPGPYALENTYIEGSGNVWHHDDGGHDWAHPGDYYYYRNHFYQPTWTIWLNGPPNPQDGPSDGNIYDKRQMVEWKDGVRLQLRGNIFDTDSNSGYAAGAAVAFSSGYGGTPAIEDVDVELNEFKHVTGGIILGDLGPIDQPAKRYRIANNLLWDVNGFYYTDLNDNRGNGWVLEGPNSMEDLVVDHNTVVGNVGLLPSFGFLSSGYGEGVQYTNNFLSADGGFRGYAKDSGDIPSDSCTGLQAKALMDCELTPAYTMTHNVLIGNGVSGDAVSGYYPSPLNNYIREAPACQAYQALAGLAARARSAPAACRIFI